MVIAIVVFERKGNNAQKLAKNHENTHFHIRCVEVRSLLERISSKYCHYPNDKVNLREEFIYRVPTKAIPTFSEINKPFHRHYMQISGEMYDVHAH